jgi:hypothetical protein
MFRHVSVPSTPEVVETNFKLTPHQPTIARESSIQLESLGKSHKVFDIWFQLFSDILDDENIIEKLKNTIKVALGAKVNQFDFIVANLPGRKESRVQIRNRRTG